MNYPSASGICIGNCPHETNSNQKSSWYCKLIKPLVSFIISVLLGELSRFFLTSFSINLTQIIKLSSIILALSVSHINDIYSSGNSYQVLKSDINALKNNLNHLRLTIDKNTEKLLEAVSSDSVTKAIRKELETYDADKTGKTDYALETSG